MSKTQNSFIQVMRYSPKIQESNLVLKNALYKRKKGKETTTTIERSTLESSSIDERKTCTNT